MTRSRNKEETSLWAHLWEIFLIRLTEGGRCILNVGVIFQHQSRQKVWGKSFCSLSACLHILFASSSTLLLPLWFLLTVSTDIRTQLLLSLMELQESSRPTVPEWGCWSTEPQTQQLLGSQLLQSESNYYWTIQIRPCNKLANLINSPFKWYSSHHSCFSREPRVVHEWILNII